MGEPADYEGELAGHVAEVHPADVGMHQSIADPHLSSSGRLALHSALFSRFAFAKDEIT